MFSPFRVYLSLEVDHEENILPVDKDAYDTSVGEILKNLLYEVEGIKVKELVVNGLRID